MIKRVEELERLKKVLKGEINSLNHEPRPNKMLIKALKNILSILNMLLPPSKRYDSYLIKRLLFKQFRDKAYICDEVSFDHRSRFDVIMVERFTKKRRVVGFEIKTSMQDLKNDKKFENYLNYCNSLYFVVPDKLKDSALEKVKNSNLSKYIGVYVCEDGNLKCVKKALSNKKQFDLEKIERTIIESAYFRYVY